MNAPAVKFCPLVGRECDMLCMYYLQGPGSAMHKYCTIYQLIQKLLAQPT